MSTDNPFLALFESPKREPEKPEKAPEADADVDAGLRHRQQLNDFIEDVFLVTLSPYHVLSEGKTLVWLKEISDDVGGNQNRAWLDTDLLEERGLFERLVMTESDVKASVVSGASSKGSDSEATETRCVTYLAGCFRRLETSLNKRDRQSLAKDSERVKALIVRNVVTAFSEGDLFAGQDLHSQFLDLLREDVGFADPALLDLLAATVEGMAKEGGFLDAKFVGRLLDDIRAELQEVSFMVLGEQHFQAIGYFLERPVLARLFVLHSFPTGMSANGRNYGDSLLGTLISKSCLPRDEFGEHDFFAKPSGLPASVHSSTEDKIWSLQNSTNERLCAIFRQLLRCNADVKHLTLMWIGDCFHANAGRGKLWTAEMGGVLSGSFVSDGFMLNLGSILMKLCSPFTEGHRNPKLLKIDCRYVGTSCVVSEDSRLKNMHLRNADQETCLLPRPKDAGPELDCAVGEPFNFITDLFFLTHKCLDLGFRVAQEKFVKLNQHLNRQQQLYREAEAGDRALAEQIQQRMDSAMTRYLSLKAALLEPESLKLMMQLNASTCTFLVHSAFQEHLAGDKDEEALAELSFPLPDLVSPRLYYIPEFLIENICEHILLARRFWPRHFEENGDFCLGSIMDFVLCFMASPHWVRNPHMRARMAECLECLLPHHSIGTGSSMNTSFYRDELFRSYKFRLQIVPTLLNVFVNIESTGQSVAFEQKFSYRRPMYDVMKYLWDMDEYREKFVSLAQSAEEDIEAENAPLFLRFVNLLINDAIFLLDEALHYMKQIGEQQTLRETEWPALGANERGQNEAQLQHIGRLARYHNIMGMDTIEILDRLTAHTKAVFTHSTMVDRIAAMLNYFLKSLVGPERKSFKVKNLDEFDFRPANVVIIICKIYVNLKECQSFISAVSQDGRSYSPELFEQTESVLVKIGHTEGIADLRDIATRVGRAAAEQKEEDSLFEDAPDHFLDPIMSIIMRDPVRLPSSGQIVDRQTIARHLLSDQNDPFNRAPLSLDKVVPQVELKQEIWAWMEEKKKREQK